MGLGDAHAQRGEDILPWHAHSYLTVPSMDGHRKLLFPVRLRSAQLVLPLSLHSSHCCLLSSVYYGLGQALWWVQETKD